MDDPAALESASREELLERLRRATQMLCECEEENRVAFELSGVGQTLVEVKTQRFLTVNQAFCKILGYSSEELLQRTIQDVSHPADSEVFPQTYQRIESGEISEYAVEKRYIHKDGRIVWVSINASMLPAKPGQTLRMAAVIRDITSQKLAEAAAQESSTRLRAIFENSVDAIAVYKGYVHAMVNPAYVKLFGYDSAEELIGIPGPELIAPSKRALIEKNIKHRMNGKPVPSDYITRGFRKDGTEFDLEIHASHFDLGGERFRLVILRDVSERLRIEHELQEAHAELEQRVRERTRDLMRESRKRKQLEAEMREVTEREQRRIGQDLHDGLGQQLAGISFMASALVRASAHGAPPPVAKLHQIANLLTEALRHTREISRGLYPIELEEEGLFFALHRLAERVEHTSKVRCVFANEKEFVIPKPCAKELYRIAQEATNNAVTHGNPSHVQIELKATRDAVQLSIADNGVGFSKAEKQTCGMGLSTMQNRARLLDGNLELRQNPEGGVTVICTIPRHKSRKPATA
jgi:two-component system sensor kinase FixL